MSGLRVRGLTVSYRTGGHVFRALSGVDIAVWPGSTLGLVGESGSGKSTLAKAIVGLVPVESGMILLDGTDVTSARARSARVFRRRVQLVFQDPYASLDPRMRIRDVIAEALELRDDVPRRAYSAQIERLLESVELPASSAGRLPFQFSGGQRQRIAIARALAADPSVLIADEVTSALDVSVQAAIINLLRRLQRERGFAMVFVSHNLGVVRYLSDRTAVMTGGRIIEEQPTRMIFEAPQHDYTRRLIASVPRMDASR